MLTPAIRLLSVAAAVTCATLVAAPLGGCQAANDYMAHSAEEKAMAMLPQGAKDLANQYLGGMDELNKLIAAIKNPQQALSSLQQLSQSTSKVSQAVSGLNNLSPETRQNVLTAFGSQLKGSNDGFMSHLSSIKNDSGFGGLGSILGPALDKVPLFK